MAQYYQNSGLTHSRTLLPMAEDLLKNLELAPSDIDAFAVAIGPGSFTGIRIGVATVKGMAFALDKPCYGVSSLEAMAYQVPQVLVSAYASASTSASASALNEDVFICPVMDARRNQVYNALFKIADGRVERLTEDRAISLDDLFAETQKKQLLLVGDGAELCYNWLNERGTSAMMLPENIRFQSAWGVAAAAEAKAETKAEVKAELTPCSAHELSPQYIRLSQAERELLEREKKTK